MSRHVRTIRHLFFCLIFSIMVLLSSHRDSYAATVDIPVSYGEAAIAAVNAGDTGTIIPNLSYIEDQSVLANFSYYFESSDTEILTVDNSGLYTAVYPGTATVYVNVYSGDYYNYYLIFSATIQFTVNIDMTNVTLSSYDIHSYMYPEYYYMEKPYYSSPYAQVNINSAIIISDLNETNFSYTCSNPMLGIEANVYDNIITITQSIDTEGSGVITLIIYGKEC